MLQYVENKNIDRVKWDNLVASSLNGFVYSTSNYLDIVSENWDALIYGDYKIIMPLPFKKKYGIKYIIQPYFAQQLGVIYEQTPEKNVLNEFTNFLRNSFLYFAINLNFDNNIISYQKSINKTNLILNLNNSFENILSKYSTNTKRNIKKSQKEGFVIDDKVEDTQVFIDFFVSNLKKPESEQTIIVLKNIIDYSIKNNLGEIFCVKKDNELLAGVFILKSFNRYIYLAATSSSKGKELRAMFYLLNYFIEKNSNTEFFLDFEGSDIEGVKRFYKGFNAKEQNYKHIYKKFF